MGPSPEMLEAAAAAAAAREKGGDPVFGVGADPTLHKSEVLLSGFAGFPTGVDGCWLLCQKRGSSVSTCVP